MDARQWVKKALAAFGEGAARARSSVLLGDEITEVAARQLIRLARYIRSVRTKKVRKK